MAETTDSIKATAVALAFFAEAGVAGAQTDEASDYNILHYLSDTTITIVASNGTPSVLEKGGQSATFLCPAKLDTGATMSSLHADHIEHNKFDGTVSFHIQGQHFVQSVTQISYVRQRSPGTGHDERPVINVLAKIGDLPPFPIAVNLVDRGRFSRPLLVGRNALEPLSILVKSTSDDQANQHLTCSFV